MITMLADAATALKQDQTLDVMTCDLETLLALADQMPRERWEQIKVARPDLAQWLRERNLG